MKKLLFIVPLVLFSCKKETAVTETVNSDSAQKTDQVVVEPTVDSAQIKDSIVNNAPATKEVLRTGVMREVKGKTITRDADAEQLPFSIGEEFTEDRQQFILKIKNYKAGTITAAVKPADDKQNIRISEIHLPDGTSDGPFGREISHEVSKDGDVTLVISRSNMASGETKGKFSVSVE